MAAHPRISTAASVKAEAVLRRIQRRPAARAALAAAAVEKSSAGAPSGAGGGFGGGACGAPRIDRRRSHQRRLRWRRLATSSYLWGGGGAGMGGAIFSNGGTVSIINSTFSANSAIGGTGANNGQALGGAIFNRDGTLTITNSTLSADSANQGGVEVYTLGDGDHSGGDPVTANSASVTINNSILAQAVDPNADMVNPDFVSNTNDSGTSTSAGTNDLFNATSGFGRAVTRTPRRSIQCSDSESPGKQRRPHVHHGAGAEQPGDR